MQSRLDITKLDSGVLKSSLYSLGEKLRFIKEKSSSENHDQDYLAQAIVNHGIAESMPVLLYSGIVADPNDANITMEQFRNDLIALKNEGFYAVSLEDFYLFMRGEKELPEKSFLLTLDAVQTESYFDVDELLSELGFHAVMSIAPGQSQKDGETYLNQDELIELAGNGRWNIEVNSQKGFEQIDIDAAGTKGHYYSSRKWLPEKKRSETPEEFGARISMDLLQSREGVENVTGKMPTAFSFPYGDFGRQNKDFPESKKINIDTGGKFYKLAFYQGGVDLFTWNRMNPNLFLIKRIEVQPDWSSEELLQSVQSGSSKKLPFYDSFLTKTGWINSWGLLTIEDGIMSVGTTSESDSSHTFLDGTFNWRDYRFRATLDSFDRGSIQLLARYLDRNNFAACEYSPGSVRLVQRVNGEKYMLVSTKYPYGMDDKILAFSIRVSGNSAQCLVGDSVVASSGNLNPSLTRGGIGFRTSNTENNSSEFKVQVIQVEEN